MYVSRKLSSITSVVASPAVTLVKKNTYACGYNYLPVDRGLFGPAGYKKCCAVCVKAPVTFTFTVILVLHVLLYAQSTANKMQRFTISLFL